MKKIAAILLVLIYSVSVYGVTINKLYCFGKLTEVGLSTKSQMDCGKKQMSSCCKKSKQEYKVKDNHMSEKTSDFVPIYDFSHVSKWKAQSVAVTLNTISQNASHSPPVYTNGLYILYCTYKI